MTKYDIIEWAANFAEPQNFKIYPVQDCYLVPQGNRYCSKYVRTPFPKPNVGLDCVFDNNGKCIKVYEHSSWSNHFCGAKLDQFLHDNPSCNKDGFVMALIVEGLPTDDEQRNKELKRIQTELLRLI